MLNRKGKITHIYPCLVHSQDQGTSNSATWWGLHPLKWRNVICSCGRRKVGWAEHYAKPFIPLRRRVFTIQSPTNTISWAFKFNYWTWNKYMQMLYSSLLYIQMAIRKRSSTDIIQLYLHSIKTYKFACIFYTNMCGHVPFTQIGNC